MSPSLSQGPPPFVAESEASPLPSLQAAVQPRSCGPVMEQQEPAGDLVAWLDPLAMPWLSWQEPATALGAGPAMEPLEQLMWVRAYIEQHTTPSTRLPTTPALRWWTPTSRVYVIEYGRSPRQFPEALGADPILRAVARSHPEIPGGVKVFLRAEQVEPTISTLNAGFRMVTAPGRDGGGFPSLPKPGQAWSVVAARPAETAPRRGLPGLRAARAGGGCCDRSKAISSTSSHRAH